MSQLERRAREQIARLLTAAGRNGCGSSTGVAIREFLLPAAHGHLYLMLKEEGIVAIGLEEFDKGKRSKKPNGSN